MATGAMAAERTGWRSQPQPFSTSRAVLHGTHALEVQSALSAHSAAHSTAGLTGAFVNRIEVQCSAVQRRAVIAHVAQCSE